MQNFKLTSLVPALFGALILIPAASATTITFGTGGTFGFTSGGTNSVTVNNAAGVSGLNVSVTAGTVTTCNPTCLVTASATGYGVNSGTTDTSNDIDGSGLLDTLRISFNNSVTLTGITFGDWGGPDDVQIYNGATFVTTYTALGSSATVNTSGTSFQFRATESNDIFNVRSITFTVDAATTPEPATFGMMGLALVGLGIGARKKMKR